MRTAAAVGGPSMVGSRAAILGAFALSLAGGCKCAEERDAPTGPAPVLAVRTDAAVAAPATLYVPDAAPIVGTGTPPIPGVVSSPCSSEMVSIQGRFCIDRFEASLVDLDQDRSISPYYHPTFYHARSAYKTWQNERSNMGAPEMQLLPLPEPPQFQLKGAFKVKATARRGVVPNGYISGVIAERACLNAGKRLCSEEEWVTACRGELDRQFPYGDVYEQGACNVSNGKHPAAILHGSASKGHLDPRLNHFSHQGVPLLHPTGGNPRCFSQWGEDAVFDMVGNLDEWIADEEGVFLGGFYARNTKEGCLAKISAHPRAYFDYSLGIRCCR
jgi:hypothetical protein